MKEASNVANHVNVVKNVNHTNIVKNGNHATVVSLDLSPVNHHHVFCDIDRTNNNNNNNNNSKDGEVTSGLKDSCSDLSDCKKEEHNVLVQCLLRNSNYLMTLTFLLFLGLSSYMLR
jgi:hypothetical protein